MRTAANHYRRPPTDRRGSLYIAVLAVATIVSIIGFTSLHVARIHVKGAVVDNDRYHARLLALSAIEHAITEFNTNANWTADYAPGVEYPSTPPTVNGGTFAWKLVDLGNQQRQLLGIGRAGEAQCVFQVDLGVPSGWLEYGILCGGDITVGAVGKACDLTVTGAPICSNSTFTNNEGITTADVEAQVINGTVTGTATAPAAKRVLPPPDSVFEYYRTIGTPLGAVGTPPGAVAIQRQLITPYHNPFGTTNPDGIYIIDALGEKVTVRESRIVGTLVVLNASSVVISDQVNWEPAHPNFPALLVEGEIQCLLVDSDLDEVLEGVNFNPLQAPYKGTTDSMIDDSYISAIGGLIYCTGDLHIDGNNNLYEARFNGGFIVNGSCFIEKQVYVSIDYNSAPFDNPPPGFCSIPANQILRGTWRQVPSM